MSMTKQEFDRKVKEERAKLAKLDNAALAVRLDTTYGAGSSHMPRHLKEAIWEECARRLRWGDERTSGAKVILKEER